MKKVIYTACGKGVFSRDRGYQIFTCTKSGKDTLSYGEQQSVLPYVQSYTFAAGKELSSPVRYIYALDENLGAVYSRIQPSGIDRSSGRGGNFLSQAFLGAGGAKVIPAATFLKEGLFCSPDELDNEALAGSKTPEFLPEYPPLSFTDRDLANAERAYSACDKRYLGAMLDAVVDCAKSGRQILICDESEKILKWILGLSALLPLSVARQITFDTYADDPSEARQLILGVTADKVDYYSQSERYYVFDFLRGSVSFKGEASFYRRYITSLNGFAEVYRFTTFCERELAEKRGNINLESFMKSAANLDFFLHYDAAKLFADASAEGAARRNALFEKGAFFRELHSRNLSEEVFARINGFARQNLGVQEVVTLNKAFDAELYAKYGAKIDEFNINFILRQTETVGLQNLNACLKRLADEVYKNIYNQNGSAVYYPAVKKLVSGGGCIKDTTDIGVFIELISSCGDGGLFRSGLTVLERYFQNDFSEGTLAIIAGNLLSIKDAAREGESVSTCKNLVFSVCARLPRGLFIRTVINICYQLEQNLGVKGFTHSVIDGFIKNIERTDERSQKEFIETLYGALDEKLAGYLVAKIFDSGLSDRVKDRYVNEFVKQHYAGRESKGLYLAYEEVGGYGDAAVKLLYKYAAHNGGFVYACTELLRADLKSAELKKAAVEALARGILGDWLTVKDGDITEKGYKKLASGTAKNFKELEKRLKAAGNCEGRLSYEIAETLFSKLLEVNAIFAFDKSVQKFFEKRSEYLKGDKITYCAVRLLLYMTEKYSPAKGEKALKVFGGAKAEFEKGGKIEKLLFYTAYATQFKIYGETCEFFEKRFKLDFSEFVQLQDAKR